MVCSHRRFGSPSPPVVGGVAASLKELRQLFNKVVPGAVIRHRLGFRHTIAWTKPDP